MSKASFDGLIGTPKIQWDNILYKPSTMSFMKQTEIDFGVTPIGEKIFTITDTDIDALAIILVQLAYVAPTGKELDELEFDSFDFRCYPGVGSFTLLAISKEGYVADKFKINYTYS